MEPLVSAALDAATARDWQALKLLLHPYVRFANAAGVTRRGRTNMLERLASGAENLEAPERVGLRDGQIYQWIATPAARVEQPTLATRRDISRLLEWIEQLYAQDHVQFDARKVRAAIRELLENPAFGRIWILRHAGQPAGYLVVTFGYSIEFGGRDGFIDELFVAEPHRGSGVGTHALKFAAEACRELGIRALHLEVDRSNTGAQRLYRAEKFVDHDRYLMTRRLDR